jgi:hypothetical protein
MLPSVKQRVLDVPVLDGDDVGFIHLVRETVSREMAATDEVYLVKVDHWFGQKWFGFSGKLLGGVALWGKRFTVPPFHPNRVIVERYFRWDDRGDAYVERPAAPALHIQQASERNLRRYVDAISRSGTFIWYSGGTRETGRGNVMVYAVAPGEQSAWYAESVRADGNWRMASSVRM